MRGTRASRRLVRIRSLAPPQPLNLSFATGPPKRKLVCWSERVAYDVEVRLQTGIIPSLHRGFRAYLENELIPELEDRVLMKLEHMKLEQRVRAKDSLSDMGGVQDLPPYDALSTSPGSMLALQEAASSISGCKRSSDSTTTEPGDRPGVFSLSFICDAMLTIIVMALPLAGKRERLS